MQLGDLMAESYRTGVAPTPNSNNKQTLQRRRLHSKIKEQAGGDKDGELDYSLHIIRENLPVVQQYVMSRGETPAESLEDLTVQAYNCRQREAQNVADAVGVSVDDALIFLEDDEDTNINANVLDKANCLGMFSAPVEIAANHLLSGQSSTEQVDNFVDPAIVAGIINTAGEKINASKLKRAAENKPAGVVGLLSAGGTKAYNALRSYLQDPKNADEKKAILNGTITDISQLRLSGADTDQVPNNTGGGLKLLAKDLADQVAAQKKKEIIRKYLPIVIIGLVLLIIIVYVVARKK